MLNQASRIKATGGQACSKTASQSAKVRKNDGSRFVGAFCQSNVGDVSPNVLGAFCLDSGKPCDFNHSSCHGNDQLCVGRGPGYYHHFFFPCSDVQCLSVSIVTNFLSVSKKQTLHIP